MLRYLAWTLSLGCWWCSGCVTQVQWQGSAREPRQHLFDGAHGIPRAYGGGVCPRSGSHTHRFPPVPAAAFVLGPEGARDLRPHAVFFDTHPHGGRTCFRKGRHLHLLATDGP